MDLLSKPRFPIKIRVSFKRDASPGIAFWDDFKRLKVKELPDSSMPSPENYEWLTENRLGRSIADKIADHYKVVIDDISKLGVFISDYPGYSVKKYEMARELRGKVKIMGYGSLDLVASLEPFSNLIKICNENYEVMEMLLGDIVPEAFAATYNVDVATLKDALDFEVEIDRSYKSKKKKKSTKIPNGSHSQELQKNKFINWRALVGSPMLFPFLVALAVLYFYIEKTSEMEEFVKSEYRILVEERRVIIDDYHKLLCDYNEFIKSDTCK
jgi:hypothetical protein